MRGMLERKQLGPLFSFDMEGSNTKFWRRICSMKVVTDATCAPPNGKLEDFGLRGDAAAAVAVCATSIRSKFCCHPQL
jgi:hypothetical protein